MQADDHGAALGLDLNASGQKIIAAARRCFETIGVPKTRIEDIAADAGVSRQTIYKYFSNKDEIIDRIGHLEIIKVNQIIRSRMTRVGRFADKMTEAIVLSVEISRENPYLRRVIQDADLMPRYTSKQVSLFVWQREQWSGMLDHARSSGELANDLDIDRIVYWILLSQLMLLLTYERMPLGEIDLRGFVRRFIVEPLLSNHSLSQSEATLQMELLREENRALRDVVSKQALEIHGLRKPD